MSKATTNGAIWAPINDALGTAMGGAIDRALSINSEARKLAKRTLKTVRTSSEAVLEQAQSQSDQTYRSVRGQILAVSDAVEARRAQVQELLEEARHQLEPLRANLQKGVESVARQLHLATEHDVEALRKKLHSLERKVEQAARAAQHAG